MSKANTISQIATIEPQGNVSAANASEFLVQLTTAVRSESNSILLVDLKQVEFIDSEGLIALVKAFDLAKSIGRRLSFCSVAPPVRIIFELTQLDKVFEIFDNRDSVEMAFS